MQILDWLGFTWNLRDGFIDIPRHKIENLHSKIDNISKKTVATARELASFVGSIISLKFAYGPICQMMTRLLSMLISSKLHWDDAIIITTDASAELNFWSFNINALSPRVIAPWFKKPERIIYTDASDHAGAGVLVDSSQETFHCMWDEFTKAQSSTYRELKAVDLMLKSMSVKLKDKFVKLYTDNQNVVRIAQIGSMKPDLQALAIFIYNTCLLFRIDLSVSWVPRNLNTVADSFSKIFDFDDWGVSSKIFNFFNKIWGPFSCDVFASNSNFKVKKFYSLFWNPGTSGVDAFAFNWAQDTNWFVPPVHLISKTLKYIIHCRAKGTLVIPKWTSASFWPILLDLQGNFVPFVTDYIEYKYPTNFFIPGSDKNSIFAQQTFQSNVLVLRIDATVL